MTTRSEDDGADEELIELDASPAALVGKPAPVERGVALDSGFTVERVSLVRRPIASYEYELICAMCGRGNVGDSTLCPQCTRAERAAVWDELDSPRVGVPIYPEELDDRELKALLAWLTLPRRVVDEVVTPSDPSVALYLGHGPWTESFCKDTRSRSAPLSKKQTSVAVRIANDTARKLRGRTRLQDALDAWLSQVGGQPIHLLHKEK